MICVWLPEVTFIDRFWGRFSLHGVSCGCGACRVVFVSGGGHTLQPLFSVPGQIFRPAVDRREAGRCAGSFLLSLMAFALCSPREGVVREIGSPALLELRGPYFRSISSVAVDNSSDAAFGGFLLANKSRPVGLLRPHWWDVMEV